MLLELIKILRFLFQLVEKAESREKERIKEELRKQKRRESAFKNLLKTAAPALDQDDTWEEIRERFSSDEAFKAITVEGERIRIFNEFLQSIEVSFVFYIQFFPYFYFELFILLV